MIVTVKDNITEQGLTLYKYDSNRYLSISGDASAVEYANFYVSAFTEYKVNVDESDSSLINIPNQLLSGEFSGEVLFTINSVDSVLYEGKITILEREQPEDYTYTATTLKNDYNVEFATDYIENQKLLYSGNISKINWDKFIITSPYYSKIFSGFDKLEEIDFRKMTIKNDGKTPTALEKLFYGCTNVKAIYWSKDISTENATTFSQCFEGCTSLTSLDLSGWDTTNVTTMWDMFGSCTALTNLTLGDNWASNTKITEVDLSDCPLNKESCIQIFNSLAVRDNEPWLRLRSTVKNNLTDEELSIAKNKGWYLV